MKITEKLKLMLKSMLSLQLGEVSVNDGIVLYWDGTEDLKAGDKVFIKNEDEFVDAPDGEYTTPDSKIIRVEGGIVVEIIDNEAEVEETTDVEESVEQAEETPLDENPDVEPADAEPEEETQEEVSIEDRLNVLEGRVEEIVNGLNQIINSISAFEERLIVLEGKLAKVEEPSADPIDETPEVEETSHKSKLSYLRKQ